MENPETSISSQSPMPTPGKKRSARLWWVLVALGLALTAGGFYLYKNNSQEQQENLAYSLLENNENITDYEDFLLRYPTGTHSKEVQERLQLLKKMYADWEITKRSSSVGEFKTFMQRYPKSMLVKQAEIKIDSLDWKTALRINTIEAYETYVSQHPNGKYISEATTAVGSIRDTTVGDEEMYIIAENLHSFFHAFGEREEASMCTYIAPTMTQFLSKRNATKADVVALVEKLFNENIESCRFVVNNDLKITKTTDANGNVSFLAKASVDQHIQRTNPGKTFGSYTLQATFNEQYIITSLIMTEVSRNEQSEESSTIADKVKNLIKT